MNKAQTADELSNSRPLNHYLRSKADEVAALCWRIVDSLREKGSLYRRIPDDPSGLYRAVRLLLLNVLYIRFSDPSRYVALGMRVKVRTHGFGPRVHRRALKGFEGLGLISLRKGFWSKAQGRGRNTRIRSTPELSRLVAEYGVRPHMITRGGRRRTIEMRWGKDRDKRTKRWPQDASSQAQRREMKANLDRINAALETSFIGLHVSDETLHQINRELRSKKAKKARPEASFVDFYRRRLHRVFNDGSPILGGRFYGGWWEALPKKYRKFIHIAAKGTREPVWAVECDYGSMHPTLAYIKAGAEPPSDCYRIEGLPETLEARAYAKNGLLILLNAKSRTSAERAIRREFTDTFTDWWRERHPGEKRPRKPTKDLIPQGCPDVPELLDLITAAHAPIAQFLGADAGKQLMFSDSQIAERVMLRMSEQGSIALPVHDSFLVPKEHQGLLHRVMQQSFQEITGSHCRVTEDNTELDYYRDLLGNRKLSKEALVTTINQEGREPYTVYWGLRGDWEALHRQQPAMGPKEHRKMREQGAYGSRRTARPSRQAGTRAYYGYSTKLITRNARKSDS